MSTTEPPYEVFKKDGRDFARLNGDKSGLLLGPRRTCDGGCGNLRCRLTQHHVVFDDGVELWLCESHFRRVS
jgi:hypothetical protein